MPGSAAVEPVALHRRSSRRASSCRGSAASGCIAGPRCPATTSRLLMITRPCSNRSIRPPPWTLRAAQQVVDVALVDLAVLQHRGVADARGVVGDVRRELADLHLHDRPVGRPRGPSGPTPSRNGSASANSVAATPERAAARRREQAAERARASVQLPTAVAPRSARRRAGCAAPCAPAWSRCRGSPSRLHVREGPRIAHRHRVQHRVARAADAVDCRGRCPRRRCR